MHLLPLFVGSKIIIADRGCVVYFFYNGTYTMRCGSEEFYITTSSEQPHEIITPMGARRIAYVGAGTSWLECVWCPRRRRSVFFFESHETNVRMRQCMRMVPLSHASRDYAAARYRAMKGHITGESVLL